MPLQPLLESAAAAMQSDRPQDALRYLDSAHRLNPDSDLITQAYARACLAARQFEAAARILGRRRPPETNPDLEAILIQALTALGRHSEAADRLHSALRRFAVAPGSALAQAAGGLCAAAGTPGWIALAPELEIWGEAAGRARFVTITAGGKEFRAGAAPGAAMNFSRFRMAVPEREGAFEIRASVGGRPLAGSGLPVPPDYAVDGRANFARGVVEGWVTIGWAPDEPVEIRLADGRNAIARIRTTPDPAHFGRHTFQHTLASGPLRGDAIAISAILPGGRAVDHPSSPLLSEHAIRARFGRRPAGKPKRGRATRGHAPCPVAIVVPVYRGYEETIACLDSVIATASGAEIVVVDDASPEPELRAALDALAASGAVTLLRNAENLGYPATVNRALSLRTSHDVIVLNSDTLVCGDWVGRLRAAAYAAPGIGTVTPLSDDDSIVSYRADPGGDSGSPDLAQIDRLAARLNEGLLIDLPAGVGFCLYLRRDCIDEVGALDQETFGKGYGEEADFCTRARGRGWRNVLAANVFVHHSGGRSFGTRRAALIERAAHILVTRYPDYDRQWRQFVKANPLGPLRRQLDEARLTESNNRHALLVSHALGGGVDRFVGEREARLREQGIIPITMRPAESGNSTCAMTVGLEGFAHLRYRIPGELKQLEKFLKALGPDHIEIHHFLGQSPRMIPMLRSLGAPYDAYIHDYIWTCPRVTLIQDGRYCGEPETAECEKCIRKYGTNIDETISVADLRTRSGAWLRAARHVYVPSQDTKARLLRYFPDLNLDRSPWEELAKPNPPPPPMEGVTRVALIGAINVPKGYRVLLACAQDAAKRNLPLEFVVIGYTEDDQPLIQTGKVFVTGKYEEAEVADIIARERPSLAFFPGIWPETWCYALTHAMKAGLCSVAFDIGAIAERIVNARFGSLVPPNTSPARLNDILLNFAAKNSHDRSLSVNIDRHLDSRQLLHDVKFVARPGKVILMAIGPETSTAAPIANLAAAATAVPLSRGVYLFSVDGAVQRDAQAPGGIALPAVSVGLAPGADGASTELISSPTMRGPWLCEAADTLVVKVSGTSSMLMLTSICVPGGSPLSIRVERLGSQGAASEPTAEAPTQPPDAAANVPPAEDAERESGGVPFRIVAHIRNRGDVPFANGVWAGRIGRGHSIEAFWVEPQDMLAAGDVEYKGLTATGFETPWLTDSVICGTRGMATPLLGFAVRLTAKPRAKIYDCEYTGYFQSGKTAGPFRNGAPCKSPLPNDPLEGIRLFIRERASGQTAHDDHADVPPRGRTAKTKQRRAVSAESGGDPAETVTDERQPQHGPVADIGKRPLKDAGRKIGASRAKHLTKSGDDKIQVAEPNLGKNGTKPQKKSKPAKLRPGPQKAHR
jgi:GT2 family glycosyltransferase/glycosyltransferase involved in cell wall biosynthesis